MTDLERLARALCKAQGHDPDADWRRLSMGSMVGLAVEPGKEQCWRIHVREVRAVLRELREPSEGMIDAACCHQDSGDPGDGACLWGPKGCLQAMIDKILDETET